MRVWAVRGDLGTLGLLQCPMYSAVDPQHIRDGNVKANTEARIRAWGCVVEGLVETPSPFLLGERGVEGKGPYSEHHRLTFPFVNCRKRGGGQR